MSHSTKIVTDSTLINSASDSQILTIHPKLTDIIARSNWTESLQKTYKQWLFSQLEINRIFHDYFENRLSTPVTPILIYHEQTNDFVTLFVNRAQVPPEPGEPGCILSYIRAYGYGDGFLNSDCYGQLSCSSCAIEIMGGHAENSIPREEEFDMLDIDEDRPKTPFTRLSCQTVVGNEPLIVSIRKTTS